MKLKINWTKAFILFLLLSFSFISCGSEKSVKAIEKDCEYLKTILPDASIQASEAVDDGMDMDQLIEDVKNRYKKSVFWFRVFRKDKADVNGIHKKAFAFAIKKTLKTYLTRPDSHMSVAEGDSVYYLYLKKFVFKTDLFFEKKGDDYFVTRSPVSKIKEGMKYTGNPENIVQTFSDGKVVYRFIVLTDAGIIGNKAKVNLDGKNYKVPGQFDGYNLKESKDISYTDKDGVLTVSIRTLHPRFEKNTAEYEELILEISKKVNNYDRVVFDLRGNTGGYIRYFIPILAHMLVGDIDIENDERYAQISNQFDIGRKELYTETIRNSKLLDGYNISSTYFKYKDSRYHTYELEGEPLIIEEPAFKGKIFVITDIFSASASESTLGVLKKYFKDSVTQIGLKTSGCIDFGGVYPYLLPDSKIRIRLCCADYTGCDIFAQESGWHGDTNGFYPDYWIFSEDEADIEKACRQL